MFNFDTFNWYVDRFLRMSSAEIVHRFAEQLRRQSDQRKKWSWNDFGNFESNLRGLPAFDRAVADRLMDTLVQKNVAETIAGHIVYFGKKWPAPVEAKWWQTRFWQLDPETQNTWLGFGKFGPTIPYRFSSKTGDPKYIWELNRLQFLAPVALAMRAKGDEAIAFEMLDGWMNANPPFSGISWANGIEAATRVASVLALLAVADVPSKMRPRILSFFDAHIYLIRQYPSLYSSGNNHRVAELAALFLASTCLPGMPGSHVFRAQAKLGLEGEMLRQFHSDGVGVEQSPTYAAWSLEWFALAAICGESIGETFSEQYRQRVCTATEWFLWMSDDSGQCPRIGDDDETRVLALTREFESRYPISVAALCRRWLSLSEPVPSLREKSLRDAVATNLNAPSWKSHDYLGVKTFREGGYTVERVATNKGLARFVLDHGPLGFSTLAAHGHADALSIWFSWGPEVVFADAGTFVYYANENARDYFRTTDAHNTLSIEGSNQSRIAGPFMWTRHARARLLQVNSQRVVAEQDGYRKAFGLVHRRLVVFNPNGYTVEDQLIGKAAASELKWITSLRLAPNTKVTLNDNKVHIETPLGRNVLLESEFPSQHWSAEEVPHSPRFGVKQSTIRVTLRDIFKGEADTVARFRIYRHP